MENILIAFTADTGGIDEANKKLDELRDRASKASEKMSEISKGAAIDKTTTQSIDDTRKSIDDLSKAQKGLVDNLALKEMERAYKSLQSEIAQMRKSLVDTLTESKAKMKDQEAAIAGLTEKYKNLRKQIDESVPGLAQQNLVKEYRELGAEIERETKTLSEFKKEVKDNADALKDVDNQVKKVGKAYEDAGSKAKKMDNKTVTAELRQIKNEMAELSQAGLRTSERYAELRKRAEELTAAQKNVNRELKEGSSATRGIDTALQSVQLLAGGFSAAQGAMALFGAEGEDLQKIMVKLQAGIALTTGIQQVQNAIQKQSNIMRGIAAIQDKAAIAATNLNTAAQGKNIVVTKAATVAQRALNLVAKANPYVLLAMAILTVVGALYAYASATESAYKKQVALAEIEKIRLEQKERYYNSIKDKQDDEVKQLERELSVMKKLGVASSEIDKKQDEILQKKLKNAQDAADYYKDEIANIDKNKEKVAELKKVLDDLAKAEILKKKRWTVFIDGEFKNVKVNDKDFKKSIQSSLDKIEPKIKLGIDAKEGIAEANQAIDENAAEQKKKAIENSKTEAIAAAKVRLIEAKKGSQEELNARVRLLKEEERVYLQNTELTNSQRKQKHLETLESIKDAEIDFQNNKLENEKYYNEAMVALTKDGTDEQFSYRLQIEKNLLDQQLLEKNLSDQKRLYYEETYLKKVEDMTKQHNARKTRDQLDSEVSGLNARLNNIQISSQEEYNTRVALADKMAALAENEARLTIQNQEQLAARLKEIDSERIRGKQDALANLINAESDANQQVLDLERANAASVLASWNASISERIKARKTLNDFELNSLQEEKRALDEMRQKGAISEENYNKQLTDITIRESDIRTQKRREEMEMAKALFSEFLSAYQSISDSMHQVEINRLNQQLQDLKEFYTTDAEEAKKNSELQLISKKEYAEREKKIKKEIAEKEKKQAIASALMSSAQAIARAFADYPFPYSAIVAALVAATTISQIAAIKSQPTGYWKGRKKGKGEVAWVGEQGPELMYVPDGASIVPHRQSKMIASGDTNMADKWNLPQKVNPFIPVTPYVNQEVINEFMYRDPIDYDKLGKAIAKHQKPTIVRPRGEVHVNVDSRGVTVRQSGSTINYRNYKYEATI